MDRTSSPEITGETRLYVIVIMIMKPEVKPLPKAAQAKGCRTQPARHTLEGQVAAASFFGIKPA